MKDKKMIVYFDDEMNIKSISPIVDESLEFRYTEMSSLVLLPYLRGEKSLSSCYLSPDDKNVGEYTLEMKSVKVNTVKIIDKFLHQMTESTSDDFHLKIYDDPNEKMMTIKIIPEYCDKILKSRKIESKYISIEGVPELHFYVTTKNDPSFLMFEVIVPTNKLIGDGVVMHKYEGSTENCSIFTRKIFNKYIYERQT